MDFSKLLKNLHGRRFAATAFKTGEEAAAYLEKEIAGEVVGLGGSMTLKAMDVQKRLSANNTVYWHWIEPKDRLRFPEFTAYVTSVNAIAETGELVNIDGSGNRVAASIFGPKKFFFVVGRNKVARDLEAAIHRARNIASPPNCKRLNLSTPCVKDMICHDCRSPDRICNVMAIHMGPMVGAERTEVLLVDEELGY